MKDVCLFLDDALRFESFIQQLDSLLSVTSQGQELMREYVDLLRKQVKELCLHTRLFAELTHQTDKVLWLFGHESMQSA